LYLRADPSYLRADQPAPPQLVLEPADTGAALSFAGVAPPDSLHFVLSVPAAPDGAAAEDDQLAFCVRGGPGVPPCRVVLRRTAWQVRAPLIEREKGGDVLPQTRAALLWYGWKRYRGLVGLKRFTSGLSGTDVLVFQPMLPGAAGDHLGRDAGTPTGGSLLLTKTGPFAKMSGEWQSFRDHVADRAHPFMSRYDEFLSVQPAGPTGPDGQQGTVVGSFLGGDVLHLKSLESVVRGPADEGRCHQVLEQLFALLAPWYSGSEVSLCGNWGKVFGRGGGAGILLFGKYDWSVETGGKGVKGLRDYTEALCWDTAFITEPHLCGHLLGLKRDADGRLVAQGPGLLHLLRDRVRVRFSVTHGDLHPRNVLADRHNVWLLDFGEAGAEAPTLYDFAKLEVFLRLWCLDLAPSAKELDEGVAKFEKGLLDALLGTTDGPEVVGELAGKVGAQPHVLRNVASCIIWLRRRAAAYGTGGPERLDYLTVLFLTVLQTLRYAGKERDRLPNYRMLVTLACLLEDALSRLMGLPRFPRGRESLDYRRLITAEWLAAPGAPARIAYLMRRRDGSKALPFLAATRGVLQNAHHHLDVFDHTLLVMACLEEVLRDPLAALLDPPGFERRVDRSLRRQRLPLNLTRSRPVTAAPPDVQQVAPYLDRIRALLDRCLDDRSRLLLKWVCLLHDVGKPATRYLQVDGKEKRVQFRGHEAYSAFMAEGHLPEWFPDEREQRRLAEMVRYHHLHHQLLDKYADKPPLTSLLRGLQRGDDRGELLRIYNLLGAGPADSYMPDFPLLMLHGFADVAACAGPASSLGLDKVARMGLAMLAAWARFPQFQREERTRQQVLGVVREAGVKEGREYGELVKKVLAGVNERWPTGGPGEDGPGPTDEDVRAEAERICRSLAVGR
jgi:hypothetical protein